MILNLISLFPLLCSQISGNTFNNLYNDNNYYPLSYSTDSTSSTYFNDTEFSSQWFVDRIELDKAWRLYKPNKTIKIAVLDQQFYLNDDIKEFLNKNKSISFVDEFKDPFIEKSTGDNQSIHGGFVAIIISAKQNNNYGIAGIVNNIELYLLTVLNGQGKFPTSANKFDYSSLINAINYCNKNNVDIINMSLHCDTPDNKVREAIENYKGLIVCASSNSAIDLDKTPNYPSGYGLDNVITVGATTSKNDVWTYSNYGKNSVDVFAPGENIPSFYLDTITAENGTSMATPIVTGLAAMYLSINTSASPSEIKNKIINSVDKYSNLTNYCKSGGIVNALNLIHEHNYTYEWISTKKHTTYCSCLEIEIQSAHIVAGGSFLNGNRYAYCLKCGGLAEMGIEVSTISSDDNYYELINGKYYVTETRYVDDVLNLSYKDYVEENY